MYIESEHIKKMINDGKATVVDGSIVKEFFDYIQNLKWTESGTMLDFDAFSHKKINLSIIDEVDLEDELKGTLLNKNKKIIFSYSEDQCGVICDLIFGLRNIDYFYWKAPGARFMFGGEMIGGKVVPYYEHIAMYDGAELLYIQA